MPWPVRGLIDHFNVCGVRMTIHEYIMTVLSGIQASGLGDSLLERTKSIICFTILYMSLTLLYLTLKFK